MTATLTRRPPTRRAAVVAAGRQYLRPAPRREPGFDDELVPDLRPVGPLDRPLPFAAATHHRPVRPAAPLPRTLPEPVAWGRRLLVGIIETAGGRRPLQQLAAMLSPSVACGLRGDFERAARAARPHWTHTATIRSVHASEPAEGIAELNATVQAGRRARAIAMRLEEHNGRWWCTRLQLG
jgi:hypothetical protein